MAPWLALLGWALAAITSAALVALARGRTRRARLIGDAAHELSGPLTAARLGLRSLTLMGGAPAERAKAVEHELRRACRALGDLRTAPAGIRAAEQLEEVDVAELVGEVASVWQPVASALGAELRVRGPAQSVTVRGDRDRLARACANLVANALEHGGNAVELRWRVGAGRVWLEVADDGPGLPARALVPGGRGPIGTRRGRGDARGRGLAIVAATAARHGGSLVLASTQGGAQLGIELPTASPTTV